jgi:hypothetical protein
MHNHIKTFQRSINYLLRITIISGVIFRFKRGTNIWQFITTTNRKQFLVRKEKNSGLWVK